MDEQRFAASSSVVCLVAGTSVGRPCVRSLRISAPSTGPDVSGRFRFTYRRLSHTAPLTASGDSRGMTLT
jgi:hypothetical protein